MLDNKILSFLPKVFLPNSILDAKSGERFIKSLNSRKIFIVISPTVARNHGEKISSLLQNCTYKFFELGNEPTIKDKENALRLLGSEKFDLIIGIGGGSVLDLAKVVKMESGLELVLIPTTIGSGSEASQFSLLINENGEKVVFASYNLLPNLVIFDPSYCQSSAREVISYSIIDALSHALEGLVSRNSNEITDILATKAIDVILENGLKAAEEKDIKSLAQLQIAGFLAGIVQSTASVGLIHAIANSIGPKNNLGHGKVVSLYLMSVLKFNKSKSGAYKKLDSCKNINSINFIEKLEQFLASLKISSKNKYSGDAEAILKDVCARTNPYAPTNGDIEKILNGEWS